MDLDRETAYAAQLAGRVPAAGTPKTRRRITETKLIFSLHSIVFTERQRARILFHSTNTSSWTSNFVANETSSSVVALVMIESTGTRPPHSLLRSRLMATNDKLLTIP